MRIEKSKENKKKFEFEFCKVCRINHDQGRRHNYFPRHTNSLSSLLARFHKKISTVKSSLRNPSFIRFEHGSCDRFWCVFCEIEIDELGSSFASANGIKHLLSEEHLKNLKHFLWKYGGGMDRVDSFRVTETELAKWEKKCEALRSEAASSTERSCGAVQCYSNDIRPNYELTNNLDKNNFRFLISPSSSNDVLPLQYSTNENYQVHQSGICQVGKVGPSLYSATSSMPQDMQHDMSTHYPENMSDHRDSQHSLVSDCARLSADSCTSDALVHRSERMPNGQSSFQGLQNLTRISFGGTDNVKGNIHSGALPPWFEGPEAENHNYVQKGKGKNTAATTKKSTKTGILNPKRVGAVWAEKRKIELELERRGEINPVNFDPDWLPEFGRVWQSGTRKESRKEFEKEKKKISEVESPPEAEIVLQPYISKRMRKDANDGSSESSHV